MRNRFKELDLIGRSDELWTEVHDIVQDTVVKTISKKINAKGIMVVPQGLTNS